VNERITIITGAVSIPDRVLRALDDDDILLAADSGLDHALAAGLAPSGVFGDMVSISDGGLQWATEHATISRHPVDKNQTDTELALAFAVAMNPARITLVGGGDRLDHTLGGIGALGHPTQTGVPELVGWWDGQHVRVQHGPGRTTITVPHRSTISLLALHGTCTGVVIRNVEWELDGAELSPAVGWGLSNLAGRAGHADDSQLVDVEVAVSTGVLTIFDHGPQPLIAEPHGLAERNSS
jgi:thiamine pyrophosphokinase